MRANCVSAAEIVLQNDDESRRPLAHILVSIHSHSRWPAHVAPSPAPAPSPLATTTSLANTMNIGRMRQIKFLAGLHRRSNLRNLIWDRQLGACSFACDI